MSGTSGRRNTPHLQASHLPAAAAPRPARPAAGLIQAIAGGGDVSGVDPGPLIGAILGDPQAAAQLPALLDLVQRFGAGLPLGGGSGGGRPGRGRRRRLRLLAP